VAPSISDTTDMESDFDNATQPDEKPETSLSNSDPVESSSPPVIEQLLEAQDKVIGDLEDLNGEILSAIEAITAQRKASEANSAQILESESTQDSSSRAA